jgi:hypothetical protein
MLCSSFTIGAACRLPLSLGLTITDYTDAEHHHHCRWSGITRLVPGRWLAVFWRSPSAVTAAKFFIPAWLAVALINMWIGVSRAGYSVADEFPIFLAIFAIPAAVAVFVWWKYS